MPAHGLGLAHKTHEDRHAQSGRDAYRLAPGGSHKVLCELCMVYWRDIRVSELARAPLQHLDERLGGPIQQADAHSRDRKVPLVQTIRARCPGQEDQIQ